MSHERLNDLARTIIDSNKYIVLGTADQVRPPKRDDPRAERMSTFRGVSRAAFLLTR
jgi:hypothetical protein